MTKRYGPGMPADAIVNAMADAIRRTNQYNYEIELTRLRAENAALRSESTQLLIATETALRLAQAELTALRPLKPIAEAAIAWHDTPYDDWAVCVDYADGLLGDVIKAYLAAQEGGTK